MPEAADRLDSSQPPPGGPPQLVRRDLHTSAVRSELARILASSQFENAKRLQDFLSFIVESTLRGTGGYLKESLIGVQVFDREAGFDPKLDPVVRVTARRLRDKLEEFYAGDTEPGPIRIQLAKGSYVPTFSGPRLAEAPREVKIAHKTQSLAAVPNNGRAWMSGFISYLSPALIGSLSAIVLAVVLLRSHSTNHAPEGGPVSRFSIVLPPDQELVPYYGRNLAFSPDGQSLAYVANQSGTFRLFIRNLSEDQSQAVPDSEGAAAPLFASDGQAIIAYVPGRLRRFQIKGGHTDLTPLSPKLAVFGSAWDGTDLLYDDAPPDVLRNGLSAVFRLSPGSNRKPLRLTSRSASTSTEVSEMIDQTLPDRKGYLLSMHGTKEWLEILLPGGSQRRVVENARGGIFLPTGYLAFWSDGDLRVAPLSLSRLELTGPQVTAVKNVGFSGWEGSETAVSLQGTLAYVERSIHMSDRRLVWVDHSGKQTPLPIPPAPIEPLSLSPNGRNLLLTRYDRGAQLWTLWNYSLVDGSSLQLTQPSPNAPYACWSPDGRSVVYASNRISGRATNLFVRPADAPAQREEIQITHFEEGGMVPYSWSADGKWIVGTRGMLNATKSDIFAVPVGPVNFGHPRALVQTPDYDKNPDLSPDGRWVAYETEDKTFVRMFDGGEDTTSWLVGDGNGPLWDPSGRRLYLRRGRSLLEIPVRFDPDPHFGTPKVLFTSDAMQPDLWIRNALLSRDGKRFLMVVDEGDKSEGHRINIVVNWFTEVRNLFHPQP